MDSLRRQGPIAIALLSVFALSSQAGVVYHYSTKSDEALHTSSSGRMWIDGDRIRLELDADPGNPRPYDIAITANGKTTFINLENKTYFHEIKARREAQVTGSALFHLPVQSDRIKGKPAIAYRNLGDGGAVGAFTTTRHEIHVKYTTIAQFQGVSLKGAVDATVTVLLAGALPRNTDSPLVRTGFPAVDEEAARLLAALEGMVVGWEMSVSRTLEDGPRITEVTTMSIDELKVIDIDAKTFAVPPGLTFQEPVVGSPGL